MDICCSRVKKNISLKNNSIFISYIRFFFFRQFLELFIQILGLSAVTVYTFNSGVLLGDKTRLRKRIIPGKIGRINILQIKATKHSNIISGSISEILRRCPFHALVTSWYSSTPNEGLLSFSVFIKGACSLRGNMGEN